jgi:hypothetical protein
MAEIKVEVCDVCLDRTREVTRWTIRVGTRSRTLSLCSEHAQPLIDMMGAGSPEKPSAPRKSAAPRKSTTKKSTGRRRARSASGDVPEVRLTDAQRRKLEEIQRREG